MKTSAAVVAHATAFLISNLVLAGARIGVEQTTRPAGPTAVRSTPVQIRANQLGAESVYRELTERGLDPLDAASPEAVRAAYVDYQTAVGDSLSLLNSPGGQSSAEGLSTRLSETALRSQVRIRTTAPGARVVFRLIGRTVAQRMTRLTNDAIEEMPIGLYQIWSERNGAATSSTSDIFRIIRRNVEVDLEETLGGR